MSDITCCTGKGCPLAAKCWRTNAPYDTFGQSVFAKPPWDEKAGECMYFWPMTKKGGPRVKRHTG
jgi:hypothetical protein